MEPERPLDMIHIRDLQARCIVGLNPEERTEKQEVIINITLHADLRDACKNDCAENIVDYKKLKKRVLTVVEGSSCFLLERLAQRVAEVCLEAPLVERVDIVVDKPGALRFARSAAVQIVRYSADTRSPDRMSADRTSADA